ncbi:MAG: undecaprenyl-diphosphatase UppP [Anaerolineae bacterium UTCFX2]|jgi:undecaprenyl-diphosphatase|nr:undecaprenyl-diphosphatase UppP [Anaerolineae bacterium]MCZ7552798.1 undecaprenyl-diphosphatase UppP [Anaerolineales bacterium]OQY92694.1 MAG: undecaprenyl-diphosphatase UppP [Anaerolineae bacterium UTCFX2]
MTILQAILLGIIQGLTEFLPISSSAHLVLTPYLLGWEIPAEQAFVFDVLVQVASLVAVIVYFWQDLLAIGRSMIRDLLDREPFRDPQSRLGWMLILATLPAGVIGLLIKDLVELAFGSPQVTALFLFVTAALLILAERFGKRDKELAEIGWKDALFVGFAQALAIFPGISRSGATITGGMLRDLKRPAATRFAFLMAIPIMLAAGLAASHELLKAPHVQDLLTVFLPGLIASAVVSYFSIRWLLSYLARRPISIFAIYCGILGAVVLLFSVLR